MSFVGQPLPESARGERWRRRSMITQDRPFSSLIRAGAIAVQQVEAATLRMAHTKNTRRLIIRD